MYDVSMLQLALRMPEYDDRMEVTFAVPFTPPSKNVYDGWERMWKAGARKKWKKHLIPAIKALELPEAKSVRVAVELWFASHRRRDWQNYVHPLMYWLADSLVDAGVIPDDTPDRFLAGENGGIVFKVDRRKFVEASKKRRTVIRLELTI